MKASMVCYLLLFFLLDSTLSAQLRVLPPPADEPGSKQHAASRLCFAGVFPLALSQTSSHTDSSALGWNCGFLLPYLRGPSFVVRSGRCSQVGSGSE